MKLAKMIVCFASRIAASIAGKISSPLQAESVRQSAPAPSRLHVLRTRPGGCRACASEYHGVVNLTLLTIFPMNCLPSLCVMLVEFDYGRLFRVTGAPDNPDSRGF